LNLFKPTQKATFLARPNRFTLLCRLRGKIVRAYLPNPGRMWELLLPQATVLLEHSPVSERKMPYTAVAVERNGHPVVVHTMRTNDLAQILLENDLIPGLEGAAVVKREAPHDRSRFDFLLKRGEREIFLEVKSCTLFGKRIAMFPDAVTARGKRHLEELAELSKEGREGAVLFLIGSAGVEYFMPDFHTDPDFSGAFLKAKGKIAIFPLAVAFDPDLSLRPKTRLLKIPWDVIRKEAQDRGSYLVVLKLNQKAKIEIGRMGKLTFPAGYYLYVGSALKGLTQRIERHRRILKNKFWHIDYLRDQTEFHAAIPIRSSEDLECEIAGAIKAIADWQVPRFGCSDCSCESHLFGMKGDPLQSPRFISRLLYFRMDRLIPRLQEWGKD
jgi:sugar fermentation stimulation protein A